MKIVEKEYQELMKNNEGYRKTRATVILTMVNNILKSDKDVEIKWKNLQIVIGDLNGYFGICGSCKHYQLGQEHGTGLCNDSGEEVPYNNFCKNFNDQDGNW